MEDPLIPTTADPDPRDPPLSPDGLPGEEGTILGDTPEGPPVREGSADPRPPRWIPAFLGLSILTLIVMNNLGGVLLTKWAVPDGNGAIRHPVALLALNSKNTTLLATGFQVDWLPFLTIPFLRLLAADPLFYLLGHFYRARARRWSAGLYPGSDGIFRLLDSETPTAADRTLDALVLIAPNNPVCLIAGVAAMSPVRFAVLNVIGTWGRVVLFKLLSEGFRSEIRSVIEVIAKYQDYLFWVAIALLVVNLAVQARKLRGTTAVLED